MARTARLGKGGLIEIRFPYDPGIITQVKGLAGRRYHPAPGDRHWTAATDPDNVRALDAWGFDLSKDLLRMIPQEEQTELLPPMDLPDGLYPFQEEGVRWLELHRGRGLIADDMGLGKTVQALVWLKSHPEALPAVVVCPASIKLNWAREAKRWIGAVPVILSGKKKKLIEIHNEDEVQGSPRIIIINYDILEHWWTDIRSRFKPGSVIVDEAHYIKSSTTHRTKAVKQLCKGIKYVIALSGTPIMNRPAEIYEAIKLVCPGLFPKKWDFLKRYCGLRNNGFGWEYKGATHTDELHKKLTGTCMIRRKKEDVLPDLPAKTRTVLPLELDNAEEYKTAEQDFGSWLADRGEKEKAVTVLGQLEALKQLAVEGKIKQAIKWIGDFLESGEQLVVFCHHQKTVKRLSTAFGSQGVVVDGSTPERQRQAHIDAFQGEPGVRLFIGTLAAIEGITLTAASNVAFLELWWSPGQHSQAEDRVHRIGQEAQSIGAYYLIAAGTVEEKIARLLDRKQKVVTGVLDGEEVAEDNLLTELLKEYRAETRNITL